MQIIKLTQQKEQEIIKQVVDALLDEELVILPTDTVYGIMAIATSQTAVQKLYNAKHRDISKPTAVLVHSKEVAAELVGNGNISKLADNFWPGPLTIIADDQTNISPWDKIGVRIPDELFLLKVLESVGVPIMASSANIASEPAPIQILDISEKLTQNVALAVDSGPTKLEAESSVIEMEDNSIKIIRQGPITLNELTETINK